MKNSLWIASIILQIFCPPLTSQSVMTPTWIKLDSSVNGTSEAWGVDVDEQGHIYWATSNNQLGQGLDIYLHKFDFGGLPSWNQPVLYGDEGTQHAYVLSVTDSALFVGGRACPGLITTCDMLLLKLDPEDGNLVWEATIDFAASGYEEVDGLEIKEDGIYCAGWCQELHPAIYRSDLGLWKVNHDGTTAWTNYLGMENTAEHQDGHFVVDDEFIFSAGLWGGTGLANLYNGYAFLGKFSKTDGSMIDTTLFGSQSDRFQDIENALGMTSDGEFLYVTGYATPKSANDWQIFVSKFDKNLNQIWYIDWGGTETESARAIAVKDDIIYVAGLSESTSIISGDGRDALLLKLDTSGNVLSYETFGGTKIESFQDIVINKESIYLTGTIESDNGNKQSMLVALENEIISSLSGHVEESVKIFPNPAKGQVNLDFGTEGEAPIKVNVYDNTGRPILNKPLSKSQHSAVLMLDQKGTFYIELVFADYRVTKKVININED